MRPDQIAVQLYTLRELASMDLPGTLRAVAAAGYRSVELAGLPTVEPEALRDLLAQSDLRPMGSHEPLDRLRADLGGILDRLTVLGCPRAIVPWLPDASRPLPETRAWRASLAGCPSRAPIAHPARLSQPRVRVRAARRDDDLAGPAR
jgi:sugar phosphate isomerase/epimerase